MKRNTIITVLVIAVFAGLLLYSTLSAQRVQCDVCVTFNGRSNCASATAATETDASHSAQATACGTLSQGMAESINCGDAQPTKRACKHAA
ncbi:MAG: hypothetical protein WBC97_11775 [Gemmatimonadales bacterium]